MQPERQQDGYFRFTRPTRALTFFLFVSCLGLYGTPKLQAEEETSAEVFNRICSNCHNSTPPPRAMRGEQLRGLPPEKIFFALDKERAHGDVCPEL